MTTALRASAAETPALGHPRRTIALITSFTWGIRRDTGPLHRTLEKGPGRARRVPDELEGLMHRLWQTEILRERVRSIDIDRRVVRTDRHEFRVLFLSSLRKAH